LLNSKRVACSKRLFCVEEERLRGDRDCADILSMEVLGQTYFIRHAGIDVILYLVHQ
jgi:hypothetical protein